MIYQSLRLMKYSWLIIFLTSISYSQYALDPGFGSNGITQVDFGPNFNDSPNDMLLLPDSKLLAAGISINSFDYFIAMTRLLPDGEIDSAGFGLNGRTFLHFVLRDQAHDIELQSDDKIVVAGTEAEGNGGSQITPALYRFNADGSLDTSFADSGKIAIRYDNVSSGEFYGVSVQHDGKILAAGNSTGNANGGVAGFGAMRFLPNGNIDTTYGINGKARIVENILYHPIACLFLSDTGIVMATVSYINGIEQFVLGKMDSLGNRDTTFGDNGFVLTGIPAVYNFTGGESLALTNENKIILAGTTLDSTSQDLFSVFRFSLQGSIDSTFGTNGRTDIKLSNYDIVYDMKIDQNNKILLAGQAGNEAGLARLNPDGSPDTSFAPGGKLSMNLNNNLGTHYLTNCLPMQNGDILAGGYDFASNAGNFILTKLTMGTTGIELKSSIQPANFELLQNYPNPFNPSTKIDFNLPSESYVKINVYNLLGEKVKELLDSRESAGKHYAYFDAGDLASGVYIYQVTAESVAGKNFFRKEMKMVLLK